MLDSLLYCNPNAFSQKVIKMSLYRRKALKPVPVEGGQTTPSAAAAGFKPEDEHHITFRHPSLICASSKMIDWFNGIIPQGLNLWEAHVKFSQLVRNRCGNKDHTFSFPQIFSFPSFWTSQHSTSSFVLLATTKISCRLHRLLMGSSEIIYFIQRIQISCPR